MARGHGPGANLRGPGDRPAVGGGDRDGVERLPGCPLERPGGAQLRHSRRVAREVDASGDPRRRRPRPGPRRLRAVARSRDHGRPDARQPPRRPLPGRAAHRVRGVAGTGPAQQPERDPHAAEHAPVHPGRGRACRQTRDGRRPARRGRRDGAGPRRRIRPDDGVLRLGAVLRRDLVADLHGSDCAWASSGWASRSSSTESCRSSCSPRCGEPAPVAHRRSRGDAGRPDE